MLFNCAFSTKGEKAISVNDGYSYKNYIDTVRLAQVLWLLMLFMHLDSGTNL
jgi:hypothetical protein